MVALPIQQTYWQCCSKTPNKCVQHGLNEKLAAGGSLAPSKYYSIDPPLLNSEQISLADHKLLHYYLKTDFGSV